MPRLKQADEAVIDEAMNTGQGAGYVLEFSDRTFTRYFDEEFGIDIDDDRYRVNGTSKGKRLRAFLNQSEPIHACNVLTALWDTRSAILARRGEDEKSGLSLRFFSVVDRLRREQDQPTLDAIEKFTRDETLDELVQAIQRDIAANKLQAVMDRLHTYCMKKFAHLLQSRNASCVSDEPLHSRAGKYVKLLENEKALHPMSVRIIKSSISIFEQFNDVRNNKSLAHDNQLLSIHEARFIFDSISSILRFIRALEAGQFGG
jgi:hypothetical protein